MSSQCPKKKVHAVEDLTAASQVGNQDTTMVGNGSYFDLGSVSEGIFEPRGAGAKICSVGVCVCEGANVNIEIDSGAGVSCLLASIGVDTCPLHETTGSACVQVKTLSAGGGKVHELGAKILGLEAEGVRGDVVNLLVRFRVMNIGKALLLTQDLGRCGLGDCLPF